MNNDDIPDTNKSFIHNFRFTMEKDKQWYDYVNEMNGALKYDITENDHLDQDISILQKTEDINRLMDRLNKELSSYYQELQRYGVLQTTTRKIFTSAISYVLENADNYTGSIGKRSEQLLNALHKETFSPYFKLKSFDIPSNRIYQIFRNLIRFVLQYIEEEVEEA